MPDLNVLAQAAPAITRTLANIPAEIYLSDQNLADLGEIVKHAHAKRYDGGNI
jgi:hypothetical protein